MVTPTPNLAADPNQSANVFVQLRRSDGVPLAGAQVVFSADGCEVEATQAVSSASGLIGAEIRCSRPGLQGVLAFLVREDERLLLPATLNLNVYSPPDLAGSLPANQLLSVQAYVDTGREIDTSLRGAVRVESSDPLALLPDDHVLDADDGGAYMWPQAVLLRTPGVQTVAVRHLPTGTLLSSQSFAVTAAAASLLTASLSPRSPSAYSPATLTVTASDAAGQVMPAFAGTVRFTASDDGASLPEATAFLPDDQGSRDFTVIFATAGPQRLQVSDADNVLQTATLGSIQVGEGPAVALALSAPAAATQSTLVDIGLTPLDAGGHPTHNFADSVRFSASDPIAVVPPDVAPGGPITLTGQLKLLTPGAQLLRAKSLLRPELPAAEAHIAVAPLNATRLRVEAPPTAVAGAPVTLRVTALGDLGDVAIDYSGTVALTASDPAAGAGPTFTFTAAAGQATIPGAIVLGTAGAQTVTARDVASPSITGTSSPITVTGGAATQLRLQVPAAALARSLLPMDLVLTAADAYGNPSPSYVGSPLVTCSDAAASLPADPSLRPGDGGSRRFAGGLTLARAGATSLTAISPPLSPASLPLRVSPGPAARLSLDDVGGAAWSFSYLGSSLRLRLSAFDAFGNAATNYVGSVTVSAGGAAVIPGLAHHTFGAADAGVAGFTFDPQQAQVATFWAADPANGDLFAYAVVASGGRPQNNFSCDLMYGYGITASPSGDCFAPSIAGGAGARPTVAWADHRNGSQIYALQWNGTASWQELAGSNSAGGVSGGIALLNDQVSLAIDPGSGAPAAAWRHADAGSGAGSIFYRRYSSGSDAWLDLGGSGAGGGVDGQTTALPAAPALAFLGGQPLVVWQTQANAAASPTISARIWNGSAWVAPAGAGQVDAGFSGASRSPRLAVDGSGVATVAWANDGSGRSQIYLRQLISGAWVGFGGSDSGGGVSASLGSATAVDLSLNASGEPWLVWLDDGWGGHADKLVRVMTTDGSSWFGIGGSDSLSGLSGAQTDCQAPAIALEGNTIATVVWAQKVKYQPFGEVTCLQLRQLQMGQWVGINGSDSAVGTGLGASARADGPLLARLLPGTGGAVVVAFQGDIFNTQFYQTCVSSWP